MRSEHDAGICHVAICPCSEFRWGENGDPLEDTPGWCTARNPATDVKCERPEGHEGAHERTRENQRDLWTDGTPPPDEGGVGGFISYSEVGVGHEGKRGKARFSLIDFEFVGLMAQQFRSGLHSGRKPNDWQTIPYDIARDVYFDALMRHVEAARRNAGSRDASGAPHWAAVAVNALMLWWHERRALTTQQHERRSE